MIFDVQQFVEKDYPDAWVFLFQGENISEPGRYSYCEPLGVALEAAGVQMKVVEQFGGQDQGSNFYTVYCLEKDGHETEYYSLTGWYASYVGEEFESHQRVYPKIVEKTVWVDTISPC